MKKAWYKKWWVWVIVILFIGIFGSSAENPEVITPSSQTSTNDSVEKDSFEIGEEVKLDETSITINSLEKSSGTQWDQPKSGNEYVIVSVTIKNIGEGVISYNPFEFSMQNSQGQINDMTFTTIDSDTSLSSGELASGGIVSGTICFEQPINDTNLVLKYVPNIFSNKEIKFNLN